MTLDQNPTTLDSSGEMDPVISIETSSPFNKFMYLQASNPSASPSPVENVAKAIVVVCGQEAVVLKDKLNKVFDVEGVRGPTPLTFKLADIWEVDTTGLLQTAEDCPITSWNMCDDALCATETAKTWQTLVNDTLTLDIKEGIPSTRKFLAAITSSGAMASHPMQILICGTEEVSLASSTTRKHQRFVGSEPVTLDIVDLFTNSDDANCPITQYKLVSSSNSPLSGVEATLVTLTGSSLSIKFSEVKTIPFLVVASTASG